MLRLAEVYVTARAVAEEVVQETWMAVLVGLGGFKFFSFQTAWRTLQGYESMNMIRKGQIQGVAKGNIRGQITFIASLFGVAA